MFLLLPKILPDCFYHSIVDGVDLALGVHLAGAVIQKDHALAGVAVVKQAGDHAVNDFSFFDIVILEYFNIYINIY